MLRVTERPVSYCDGADSADGMLASTISSGPHKPYGFFLGESN